MGALGLPELAPGSKDSPYCHVGEALGRALKHLGVSDAFAFFDPIRRGESPERALEVCRAS